MFEIEIGKMNYRRGSVMLETGIQGHQELTVTENMTAESMESGCLPVFATPLMIALAEKTAMLSVAGRLSNGEDTVGSAVNIRHLSPSTIGTKVWCDSELVEIDRKRLIFHVAVFDEYGMIGEGTHDRFIIDREKFMEKARST